ncbi:MAG: glutamate--cysteine ligase [Legionellales bacterium]|nr:glutamate--cysteine ligase [Legionellales bacterium]
MKVPSIEQVPHFTTAMTGPLLDLERIFLTHQIKIEAWFRQQWLQTPPNVTCSVDLRNAGYKLAPVDTNLFPAGFNNLNRDFLPLCIQAAQTVLEQFHSGCRNILLLPEEQSKNPHYWESVATLQEILSKSGYAVRLGSWSEQLTQPQSIPLPDGRQLLVEPIVRDQQRIYVNDFCPCLVLLNNDLSTGIPDILQNIEQPIQPTLALGWAQRFKSNHFNDYQQVSQQFAALLDIDPWLLAPEFTHCGLVNFVTGEGEDCLHQQCEQLLAKIQQKYDQLHIKEPPFIVVKADSGTYGMGVMMITEPEQITHLNRKQRRRMTQTKGSQPINRVIIQEGVYTHETWNNAVAEPVVYLIGQYVVGGFYRVHTGKTQRDNLNAPGMHFEPLAFGEACNVPEPFTQQYTTTNRFYIYGVMARLAALAAARELQQVALSS